MGCSLIGWLPGSAGAALQKLTTLFSLGRRLRRSSFSPASRLLTRFPPPAELKLGGRWDGAARRHTDRKSPTPAALRRRENGGRRVRLVCPTELPAPDFDGSSFYFSKIMTIKIILILKEIKYRHGSRPHSVPPSWR